ncbi:hypothetical protein Tco_0666418, partial [Tanacetum coccineum]
MNEQSRYKQDKTKTRQSINVKSHIFNVKGDNDKSKQTPTRMSSVVQSSLKKETSTLGEIVSLNYIKSNKNVIGLTNPREAKPGPFRSPYASLKAKGYKYPFTTLGEGIDWYLKISGKTIKETEIFISCGPRGVVERVGCGGEGLVSVRVCRVFVMCVRWMGGCDWLDGGGLGSAVLICLRVHGQNFNELPTDEDIVSFFKGLVHTVEIKKTTGLDKLHLSRSQILWDMYYKNNVDYVELLCEDFTYQIDNRKHKKQEKIPKIRETKAYKTYLGYAIGVKPSKKARNFKKPASPKLTYVLVSPKEPTRKSKRVKRPAKKSTNALTECVVIRDTPMMSLSKKKEKVTVKKRKGIELLYEVALTKEAQYEEVRKKSLRDFHKTHPSGSSIVTKIAPSATKIKPSVINEGTSAKLGVLDVTKEESSKSEVESWGRDEHDSNNDHDSSSEGIDQESDIGDGNTQSDNEKGSDSEHETDENETGSESGQEENEEEVKDDEEEKEDESVKTPSNYTSTDDEDEINVESKVEDKAESDKDKGMDYTTN